MWGRGAGGWVLAGLGCSPGQGLERHLRKASETDIMTSTSGRRRADKKERQSSKESYDEAIAQRPGDNTMAKATGFVKSVVGVGVGLILGALVGAILGALVGVGIAMIFGVI